MTPTPGGPTLSALSLEGLELTPAFDPDVTSYSATAAEGSASLTATPSEGAELTVYGLGNILPDEMKIDPDDPDAAEMLASLADAAIEPVEGAYPVTILQGMQGNTALVVVSSGDAMNFYWVDITKT